jgi:uncharacterized glyoxalase superfamily protein PhnB
MLEETTPTEVIPRLIVRDVDAAIEYYRAALGADLLERHAEPDGLVGFATLGLGEIRLALSEEVVDWGWLSPKTLGGSSVLMQIEVSNSSGLADRMASEGAEIVIPVKDRPYGKREGRLRDPFGHLWIPSQSLKP